MDSDNKLITDQELVQKYFELSDEKMHVLNIAQWGAYDKGLEDAAALLDGDEVFQPAAKAVRALKKLDKLKDGQATKSSNQNPS